MTTSPIPHSELEFDMADRLRRTLRVSGIGIQEMADYLEVSRGTVSNWINGRITPDKRTRRLWALRTGAPLEWLETGRNPSPVGPDGLGENAVNPHYLRPVRALSGRNAA